MSNPGEIQRAAAECTPRFVDVAAAHPFWWEIEVAAHDDLVLGFPDGRYRPSQDVTRQALASMLYRLAGSPAFDPGEPTFVDVPADHPFFQQIEWMHAAGIATGYADSTFRPSTPITRQAVAAMAVRAATAMPATVPPPPAFNDVGAADPFFMEISTLGALGVTNGFSDGSFRPLASLTRQAMAAWLLRLQPVMAGGA